MGCIPRGRALPGVSDTRPSAVIRKGPTPNNLGPPTFPGLARPPGSSLHPPWGSGQADKAASKHSLANPDTHPEAPPHYPPLRGLRGSKCWASVLPWTQPWSGGGWNSLTAQAAEGVHFGLGRKDEKEEKEQRKEGGWTWDPGEKGKTYAWGGAEMLHLSGQLLNMAPLSTDQEVSGSYRNASFPPGLAACSVPTLLEEQRCLVPSTSA